MSDQERRTRRRGTVLLRAVAVGAVVGSLPGALPGCAGEDSSAGTTTGSVQPDPCAQYRLPDGGMQFFCCGLLTNQAQQEEDACLGYLADGGK